MLKFKVSLLSVFIFVMFPFIVGAVVGYPDGTLKPDGDITTNEVLTILSRIMCGQKTWSNEKVTDPKMEAYKKIVYNDTEAFKWYNEHSGDKFVFYEGGQWYILEDERGNIIKQKCIEEFAVELKNTMPEIYLTVKDGDTEINIIQKLGSPPHRYVLVVDKDLNIKSRRIEEY